MSSEDWSDAGLSSEGDECGKKSKIRVPASFRLHTAFSLDQLASPSSTNVREVSLVRHMGEYMSRLQIALASAVLEECIQKLDIFRSRCPPVKSHFQFHDVNSRFESFQYPCRKIVIVQEEDEELNCRKKLAEDVGLLQKGLRIAKADLLYDDHIVLHCYLRNELWKARNEFNLKYWHKNLSQTLTAMSYTSELLRSAASKARKQSHTALFQFQEQYERSLFQYGAVIEYIKQTNSSRIKQNQLFIEDEERKRVEHAAVKSVESGNERKVHDSIIKYYKHALTDIESEILRWRQKYAKDMEEMEYKTYSLYTETSRQAAKLAEVLALYCLREMQLDHYMDRKEELFYLESSEYAMDVLYTTIQSWWRGSMVRWELNQQDIEKKKKKQQKLKK